MARSPGPWKHSSESCIWMFVGMEQTSFTFSSQHHHRTLIDTSILPSCCVLWFLRKIFFKDFLLAGLFASLSLSDSNACVISLSGQLMFLQIGSKKGKMPSPCLFWHADKGDKHTTYFKTTEVWIPRLPSKFSIDLPEKKQKNMVAMLSSLCCKKYSLSKH